jgi:prolipoprotein diacylglyceryltransferase
VWAVLAAEAIALRSRAWMVAALAGLGLFAFALPLAHAGTFGGRDVALFVAAGLLVRRPVATWRRLLDATEWLANSWRSWRLGPVRIISHGVLAGAAAAAGVVIIAMMAGPASLPAVLVVAISTLVGAALWAQLVEGSPALLRPFGYYGGVIGGLAGCAAMAAAGQSIGIVLGATAVAAPWVHSLGRLRCLVQGCCHGAPTEARWGIRVVNPHSRAVALAHLDGRPIHPTPLYAIAGNVLVGALLLRAWTAGAPVWFVAGLYLIGAGLARFVEEGLRGEPQTITWRGLAIYQYLAIASVLGGVILTTWGGPPAPVPVAGAAADPRTWWAALGVGALYWFAMGVDFPESSRRFARLSG